MNTELASDHQNSSTNEDFPGIYTRGRKRKSPEEKSKEEKLQEELLEFFELVRTRRQGSGRVINMGSNHD